MSNAAEIVPGQGAAVGGGMQIGTAVSAAGVAAGASSPVAANGQALAPKAQVVKETLVAFEGFLKKAGHIAGVVLTDVVRYVIPVAEVVGMVDPAASPAIEAFSASVKLVEVTVITVQQKWAAEASEANSEKLADVLAIVELPIVTMFAQAGIAVDLAYVVNLINGVVAMLNAQPGIMLPAATEAAAA